MLASPVPPFPAPNVFAVAASQDRLALKRADAAWLEARLADAATRFVPVWREKPLVTGDETAPRAALVAAEPGWWRALPQAEPLLLGEALGHVLVALDLSGLDEADLPASVLEAGRFADLRRVGPLLPAAEGALLAYAKGLAWWHARHRFCGVCGHPTQMQEAGHKRRCINPDCAAQHFPRTDPAIIVLVRHRFPDGERCLLARNPRFPPGMHSTLAGFVEPGESLEDCVAREVREETGVSLGAIRYSSSQPWPFPASLMLGFQAEAADPTIRLDDPDEIEHAAWYSRDEVRAVRHVPMGEGPLTLPGPISISRRLIEEWLAAGD